MISLNEFINKTKGRSIGNPWNGSYRGECVSLLQNYIQDCLGQPAKARGNAIDWKTTYVNEGLGYITTNPRIGDIIVYGRSKGNGYGHVAIYIDSSTMYDQNNFTRSNGKQANYSKLEITNDMVYLRPNANVIVDNNKTLYLPATADRWRVYPLDKAPRVGNEVGFILPSKFGGLTYQIVSMPQSNVAIIDTRDYGRVQIYVDPSTGAIIK